MAVESLLNFPVKNNFKIIPIKANSQTKRNMYQPKEEFKATKQNGE